MVGGLGGPIEPTAGANRRELASGPFKAPPRTRYKRPCGFVVLLFVRSLVCFFCFVFVCLCVVVCLLCVCVFVCLCLLACLLARSLACCWLAGLLACLLACWLAGWLACLLACLRAKIHALYPHHCALQ